MIPAPEGSIRVLSLLLLLCGAAAAQTPNVGQCGLRDCSPGDILGARGELYSIKVDGGRYDDWQAELSAKGGDRIGLFPGDVSGDAWQVLSGNFTRTECGTNVVTTIITFPGGELYVDNGDLSTGFNFMGTARLQTEGDSPDLPGNAGIEVARGRNNSYTAELGAGKVRFPFPIGAGSPTAIAIAIAPVLEVNDVDDMACTWGGSAVDPSTDFGLFIGFNIYRMEDDGSIATEADVVQPEHFVYFADLFDAPGDDLSTLLDPDGIAYSGDEVLVFTDTGLEPDGTPRLVGSAPQPGRAYWYAYQPVVQGSPSDFTSV